MKSIVLMLFVLLAFSLNAAGNAPIFAVDFDESGEEYASTDGVRGLALLTGSEKTPQAKYQLTQAINPKDGTVCFWFKPMNWNKAFADKVPLFSARSERSRLLIYKNAADPYSSYGNKIVFLFGKSKNDDGATAYQRIAVPLNWRSGVWYFVAVTWSNGKLRLFLNGKLCAVNSMVEPVNAIDNVCLGDSGREQKAMTAIDEVKIYDYALTQTEIKALCEETTRK